jgi:hypothetical protein
MAVSQKTGKIKEGFTHDETVGTEIASSTASDKTPDACEYGV